MSTAGPAPPSSPATAPGAVTAPAAGSAPATGAAAGTVSAPTAAPGTERPRRYLPKLRYELIGCGLHGHELLGTDAAELRGGDNLFARESGGLRWYRCLRCDSWVVLTPPAQPARRYPPPREEVTLRCGGSRCVTGTARG